MWRPEATSVRGWREATIYLGRIPGPFQIRLHSQRSQGGKGDVAVDQLEFLDCALPCESIKVILFIYSLPMESCVLLAISHNKWILISHLNCRALISIMITGFVVFLLWRHQYPSLAKGVQQTWWSVIVRAAWISGRSVTAPTTAATGLMSWPVVRFHLTDATKQHVFFLTWCHIDRPHF